MNGICSRVLGGVLSLLLWAAIPGMDPPNALAQERAKPLAVGEKAPDFELPVQGEDRYLSLSELTKDGPVVVVVLRGYPGYQCPFCTRQLGALINRSKALATALGERPDRLVLVYPGEEKQLEIRATQFVGSKRLKSPLVMVRDPGMQMVSEWGLRWDRRRETAYPSAYLIGAGQRVKWAKVSGSHSGRATTEEILKAIKSL